MSRNNMASADEENESIKNKSKKNKSKKNKSKKKIILEIVMLVVLFVVFSNAIATRIIYDMIFARYDGKPDFDLAPYEEIIASGVSLNIPEGDETLRGYFYDIEDESGLMIIAPGLHAGAMDYIPVTDYFVQSGWDVLAFDPLGCCASTGKSTRGFSQEVADMEAVLKYVTTNMNGEKMCLFGHSRGGFAACSMLGTRYDIKAVISVSGINSAMEAIIGLSERYVGKIANVNYFNLWAYQSMLFGIEAMKTRVDELIEKSNVPVLIIQGSADKTAPTNKFSIYSYKDKIEAKNVEYILCEDDGRNGHTDLMFDEVGVNDELMERITVFLSSTGNFL